MINPETIGLYVVWFHVGTWNHILPTEAVLEGTFRYLPNEDQDQVKARLVEFVRRAAKTDSILSLHPSERNLARLNLDVHRHRVSHVHQK